MEDITDVCCDCGETCDAEELVEREGDLYCDECYRAKFYETCEECGCSFPFEVMDCDDYQQLCPDCINQREQMEEAINSMRNTIAEFTEIDFDGNEELLGVIQQIKKERGR